MKRNKNVFRKLDDTEEVINTETALQPHCHVTIKSSKEVFNKFNRIMLHVTIMYFQIAGFNKLDEAVKRLDFRSAVRDVRRFNYVCALLEMLVGQQMTALSGNKNIL